MGFFSKLFANGDKAASAAAPSPSWKPEDWTIVRVRTQGINPMVRNSDDDYYAVANVHAANSLARDCH